VTVQRRFSTRDVGLGVRMAVTLFSAGLLYAAVAIGLVLLGVVEPSWTPFIAAVVGLVAFATVGRFRTASGLALRAAGARIVDESDEPKLYATVERLASLADVPTPQLAIVESGHPNAFTVGVRRRSATIAITSGLRAVLTEEELEAVLAHELAHILNRDAGVMTVATIPRTLGETMINEEGLIFYLWFPFWWAGIPIWALGSLLTLTLSRYREFTADQGAALLTGRPAALMAALEELAAAGEKIPDEDMRTLAAVDALCVVSRGTSRFAIFSDHPPLEQRLARLAELAREMGKPVPPRTPV
jgi:heat shock protein HtpX